MGMIHPKLKALFRLIYFNLFPLKGALLRSSPDSKLTLGSLYAGIGPVNECTGSGTNTTLVPHYPKLNANLKVRPVRNTEKRRARQNLVLGFCCLLRATCLTATKAH